MENVLIINSNIMQSKRLDIILTLEGYYCIPVIDGSEAINIILKKRFDLIFFNEKTESISIDEILDSMNTLSLSVPSFFIKSAPREQELVKDPNNNVYYMDHSLISEKLPEVLKTILTKK